MAKIVDNNFWHSKWESDQLGFHQEKINSRLKKYWPELTVAKGTRVFVPLCGKSLDMLWLAESHPVLGVELSEIAARDFFHENGLAADVCDKPPFVRHSGDNIELLCGDFFDLTAETLKDVGGVFDRASLIALPTDLRRRYADHLGAILPTGCRMLLITMIYDEQKMNGPPFSVPAEEVDNLFSNAFTIQQIAESSGPDIVGNLRERGLDTLTEQVFVLEKT